MTQQWREATPLIQPATSLIQPVVPTTHSWRQYARCLGADPDIFYPAADDAGEAAKKICAVCPVREPCLEYAVTAREKEGVWGGRTEKERRRLIRQRRKSA